MAGENLKQATLADQQQDGKEKAPELTEQELAKVSGGAIKRGGADKDHGPRRRDLPTGAGHGGRDLDDLELER